jgi:Protein of unknown function (DUF3352)
LSSRTPPPSQPGQSEVLEQGAGSPVTGSASDGGGGVRRGLIIGGGVLAAMALGVGAWAAYSFIATGPQPAEALPADTLGYLSVDLDPSGGQKVEALRTLNKFPAFKDDVGIGTDDDIKKSIFERILETAPCDDLDYDDDIEPWIGDRAAVAAADVGGESPTPVLVLQVTDAAKADDGLAAIRDCGQDSTDDSGLSDDPAITQSGGWVIEGDWAVIAESEDLARDVVDAAADGSLADDEDFQHWTGEAGDSGVLTMYAGPSLGDYLAEHAGDPFGFFGFGGSDVECFASSTSSEGGMEFVDETCESDAMGDSGPADAELPDGLKQKLEDFGGVAGTVRFDDGAIELEFAGSGGDQVPFLSDEGTDDVISSLPGDTAAAFGVGFADNWFSDLLDFYAPLVGGTEDLDEMIQQMSEETGLDLPEDVETLLGDAAVVAVDSDIDPDAVVNSTDGSEVPVAVKVKGDPEAIEEVLDKLRAQAPPDDVLVFDSDAEGDFVAIGPNEDYRAKVLEEGDLGENDVFEDVVREADEASAVLFVNIDELQALIEELGGDDEELIENVEPLSGFGISAWIDGDTAHSVVRITTN